MKQVIDPNVWKGVKNSGKDVGRVRKLYSVRVLVENQVNASKIANI